VRILIVDDNRDSADSLATLLQFEGHHVQAVYSAKEGLDQAAIFEPEVLLLDIGLPEMNGYEVARRLRGIPALKKSRLIAISGYGQPEDRMRTQAAGFDDHLVKPITLAHLTQTLAALATSRRTTFVP
jgi:CheY-like chemotaxis protein